MSKEAIERFWDAVSKDAELRREVADLAESRDGKRGIEAGATAALAGRHGYAFTADELMRYLRERPREQALSERELEGVAGGLGGGNLLGTDPRFVWQRNAKGGGDVSMEELQVYAGD